MGNKFPMVVCYYYLSPELCHVIYRGQLVIGSEKQLPAWNTDGNLCTTSPVLTFLTTVRLTSTKGCCQLDGSPCIFQHTGSPEHIIVNLHFSCSLTPRAYCNFTRLRLYSFWSLCFGTGLRTRNFVFVHRAVHLN